MNLSSFTGALGRAFTGYGVDQADALRRAQLARAEDDSDADRAFKLRQAGYLPVNELPASMGASTPGAQGATGAAGGIPAAFDPTMGLGGGTSAPPLPSAPIPNAPPVPGAPPPRTDMGAALKGAFVVPSARGNTQWSMAPFEQTPTGLAVKKATEINSAKEAQAATDKATRDQALADLAKAKEMRSAQRLYNTLKAEDPKNPLVQQAFDAEGAADYGKALDFVRGQRTITAQQSKEHWVQAGVDKDSGQPLLLNTETGQTKIGGGVKPTSGGSGGQGQVMQGRMLAGISEARTADQRMRAYEDRLLTGDASTGMLKHVGGNLAMNLIGNHDPLSQTIQGAAEYGLDASDPDYLQYRRDAALLARAEQLVSSRGGSEASVAANQALARAGGSARAASIDAARTSRAALFGKYGGLAQALTPQQITKLEAGLAALNNHDDKFDYGSIGREIEGATAAAVPHPATGLTDAQVSEAMTHGATSPASVRDYWKSRSVP